jgi:sec-independent protein translocase protein TatB
MFDIDAGKILVVGVVALLVIGPKDLPRVLRTVGQTVGKMRRMASEFQNQFMEAIKEAEFEDLKKEISAIEESAKIDANFDPVSVMREEVTSAVETPKEIGHSTIDLTGGATAIGDETKVAEIQQVEIQQVEVQQVEVKEIAPVLPEPTAHEALLAEPIEEKSAPALEKDLAADAAGVPAHSGDR